MYRDVWILGPPDNGYPGGFPRGLINRVKRRWWGKERLWVCSGRVRDGGITVDIKREVNPKIIANGEYLPIRPDRFDFVFLDPPYSESEAKEMYGTGYPNPFKLLKEAWRVTKGGGHVLFLHRLIPGSMLGLPMRSQNVVAIVGLAVSGHGRTCVRSPYSESPSSSKGSPSRMTHTHRPNHVPISSRRYGATVGFLVG